MWWKRLLSALGALIFTLLLTVALITIRDFRRDPNLQWFNAGESQVVGFSLIVGGLFILATFVLFVTPLVLLWPAASQRKHWYAMLSVLRCFGPLCSTGSSPDVLVAQPPSSTNSVTTPASSDGWNSSLYALAAATSCRSIGSIADYASAPWAEPVLDACAASRRK